MDPTLENLVIRHTHRVPEPQGTPGNGVAATRQFDAALMTAGYKLSHELLTHLNGLEEGAIIDTAVRVMDVVRAMAGDHVQHNTYFRDFPRNVPDTLDFWVECIHSALLDPAAGEEFAANAAHGVLNLLALPAYGRYQHTYAEMLAGHPELIAAAGDRVTLLHLGGGLAEETERLYLALAGSSTPLSAAELDALPALAGACVHGTQPARIPVRENRAIINRVRLGAGAGLLADTVTDVLRLACHLSGGDVTLAEPTRFVSPPRPVRRALLAALDKVIAEAPAKLGDVRAHREEWKRLGERLHAGEYPQFKHAAQVFSVARGERRVPSFAGRAEELLAAGDVAGAARLLQDAPGMLFRSADRLLRTAPDAAARDAVLGALEAAAGQVSGRVLLSLREHLDNRAGRPGQGRVLANRFGRGKVLPDTRPRLDADLAAQVSRLLDDEVLRRLPETGHLVVDRNVLDVALPLSGKAAGDGLGVLPRGTVSLVDGELLRFFIYWRESARRTDFDLSALLLDGDFRNPSWLSYTNLRQSGAEHSGDITAAPNGASEFINLELGKVQARVIIPQVDVYSGEGFDEVAESFFGFMLRDAEQQGAPFEPRTVRMKSDLRGPGRVALPVAFLRGDDGRWRAKWLHLTLKGHPQFNQVEGNRMTTTALVRGIVERRFLTVRYLVDLWTDKTRVTVRGGGPLPAEPVTFIGLERPETLHEASTVLTLRELRSLIPA